MPIIVKNTGGESFEPAPVGLHAAICCDVVDKGVMETQWGPKHKIQIRWFIGETNEKGDPMIVTKLYTASLSEKSILAQDLTSWRGKPFTQAELNGFDLERLIGAACMVNVMHARKGERVYANVTAVTPMAKGMVTPAIPDDYKRVAERDDDTPPLPMSAPEEPALDLPEGVQVPF